MYLVTLLKLEIAAAQIININYYLLMHMNCQIYVKAVIMLMILQTYGSVCEQKVEV